jgi:hypothetical protein
VRRLRDGRACPREGLAGARHSAQAPRELDQFRPFALDLVIAPDRADQRLGGSGPLENTRLNRAAQALPAIRRQTGVQSSEPCLATPASGKPGRVAEVAFAHTSTVALPLDLLADLGQLPPLEHATSLDLRLDPAKLGEGE